MFVEIQPASTYIKNDPRIIKTFYKNICFVCAKDQSLSFLPEKNVGIWLRIQRLSKTLIRLHGMCKLMFVFAGHTYSKTCVKWSLKINKTKIIIKW